MHSKPNSPVRHQARGVCASIRLVVEMVSDVCGALLVTKANSPTNLET